MKVAMRSTNVYRAVRSGTLSQKWADTPKKGTTVNLTYPARPQTDVMLAGYTGVAGDHIEEEVPVVIEHQIAVNKSFDSFDWTLSLGDFANNVMGPSIVAIFEQADAYFASKAQLIANTNPAMTLEDFTSPQILRKHKTAISRGGAKAKYFLLNEDQYQGVATSENFTNANTAGTTDTRNSGEIGRVSGLHTWESAGIDQVPIPRDTPEARAVPWDNRHTAGTVVTGAVNGLVAPGASVLSMDGISEETPVANKGDRFNVSGVSGTYVVTAETTGAANAITFPFYPAAPTSGFPNDAVVTFAPSHVRNIVMADGCIVGVTLAPAVPVGNRGVRAFDPVTGLGFTMIEHPATAGTALSAVSFNVMVGAVLFRPERGSIHMSAID
jgi:hypothetical protein